VKPSLLPVLLLGFSIVCGDVRAEPAVAWKTECDSTEGWHWNNEDPGMNAKVTQFETSLLQVSQDGNDTWGKVAYVVEGIDLEASPILEVTAAKVDLNSGFMVNVASADWSEVFTVVKRTSAHGVHKGNIERAVKDSQNPDLWKSPAKFNVVVVVEGKGKSILLDRLKIRADK
jgi:hypothetical protein